MDLNIVRSSRQAVRNIAERIERARSSAEIAERLLRQGSHARTDRDKLSADIAKIDELERKLIKQMSECATEAIIAEDYINTLPVKPEWREVLRLRYVDGYPWGRVAREAGYSVDYCRRINTKVFALVEMNTQSHILP